MYLLFVLRSRRPPRSTLSDTLLPYPTLVRSPRFREIGRSGTPIGLIILAEAGLFTGAAFLMGRIGEEQLAGHTLALQIAALAFQIPFGVAQAATLRVGLPYGARHRHGIARPGTAALIPAIGFTVPTGASMWVVPGCGLSD